MNDATPLDDFFEGLAYQKYLQQKLDVHIVLDNARTHDVIRTIYPPPPPRIMRIDTPPAHRSIPVSPRAFNSRKRPSPQIITRRDTQTSLSSSQRAVPKLPYDISTTRNRPPFPRQNLSDSNLRRISRWDTGGAVFSLTALPRTRTNNKKTSFGVSFKPGRNTVVTSPLLLSNEKWDHSPITTIPSTTVNKIMVSSMTRLHRSWDHFNTDERSCETAAAASGDADDSTCLKSGP
jgi:hypothetical protein